MNVITPLVSEKSYAGAQKGVYTFKVGPETSKESIKKAVNEAFGVTVVAVRTAKVPGKTRTRGRHRGFRPGYRKAMVTLKKGEKIEELEG